MSTVTALGGRILKLTNAEQERVRPSLGVMVNLLKNKATWYRILAGFKAPNEIQLGEHSMSSGRDGILYDRSGSI